MFHCLSVNIIKKSFTVTCLQPDMDQLTQIMKVNGVPGPEFIQKLDSPEVGTWIHKVSTESCLIADKSQFPSFYFQFESKLHFSNRFL